MTVADAKLYARQHYVTMWQPPAKVLGAALKPWYTRIPHHIGICPVEGGDAPFEQLHESHQATAQIHHIERTSAERDKTASPPRCAKTFRKGVRQHKLPWAPSTKFACVPCISGSFLLRRYSANILRSGCDNDNRMTKTATTDCWKKKRHPELRAAGKASTCFRTVMILDSPSVRRARSFHHHQTKRWAQLHSFRMLAARLPLL